MRLLQVKLRLLDVCCDMYNVLNWQNVCGDKK
ncbi:hypothetical protein SAMN04488122_2570 [Chitinophaga arvensicola]|uniref:Uncharacterized protein n=1 Tax=Chitinophaga arvensicola TaxID=29529 RepID=A0A1I0RAY6_9BACT|nr:hypothetical protein SAMN04488122_2570 [Chitinophaga arvensicola]